MKKINIFRSGKHTSSNGQTLDFSNERLAAAVANYDPKVHQAPIVIGHPKTDDPAFGWIDELFFNDGQIYAVPNASELNEDFSEMVQKGSFKKVSASWYLPDSPNNPKPGELYLRHVGFLGAQAPAIKGLEAVQFNANDEETIEFMDEWSVGYAQSTIARTFKNLREFIIDKFSKEDADAIIPSYVSEDLEQASQQIIKSADDALPNNYSEENDVDPEKLKNENADLKNQLDAATTENDKLKQKVADFEEAEKKNRAKQLTATVDQLIEKGHATPAQRDFLIHFAEQLETTNKTIEFGEGEDKQSFAGADAFFEFIKGNKVIDFSERSKDSDEPSIDSLTPKEVSIKAKKIAEEEGISYNEAVNKVFNNAE